jgi:hypothetical protein
MHPVPGRQVGWEEVRAAWEQIASLNSGGQVTVHDLLVRVGSDLAYTIGTERVEVTLAGQQVQAGAGRASRHEYLSPGSRGLEDGASSH